MFTLSQGSHVKKKEKKKGPLHHLRSSYSDGTMNKLYSEARAVLRPQLFALQWQTYLRSSSLSQRIYFGSSLRQGYYCWFWLIKEWWGSAHLINDDENFYPQRVSSDWLAPQIGFATCINGKKSSRLLSPSSPSLMFSSLSAKQLKLTNHNSLHMPLLWLQPWYVSRLTLKRTGQGVTDISAPQRKKIV